MYIPEHFAESDKEKLISFIRRHSFGQLVSTVEGRPFISHIPFMVNDAGTHLQGHFAYQNPHWDGLEEQEVLVTFLGEHAYISPALYGNSGVPTWNYQSVHVYGEATIFHDEDEKKALLENLTKLNERYREIPWLVSIPQGKLGQLVGVEIEIREIQGKFKISQNRPETDQISVAAEIEMLGLHEMSKAMRQNLEKP